MRCLKRCIAVVMASVMASVMVLAMGSGYMTQAAALEPGFEISDLQTCLFEYEDTLSGINNKAVYEAQLSDR